MTHSVNVVIIGAGPAGMTTALQLKRSGWHPILLEKDRPGGALLNAERIENYPGIPSGISGADLVKLFIQHIQAFDILIHPIEVVKLSRHGDAIMVGGLEESFAARAVIVACGCAPLRLGIPGEDLAGVYHEVRDLPDQIGQTACVIGGGDVAFDYALSLAKRDVSTHLVIRSQRPNSLARLEARVREHPLITLHFGFDSLEFQKKDGSLCVSPADSRHEALLCDTILVAVGRRPNIEFLPPELRASGWGEPPLMFAGDAINGSLRQVGIAVSDGLRCAMLTADYLEKSS